MTPVNYGSPAGAMEQEAYQAEDEEEEEEQKPEAKPAKGTASSESLLRPPPALKMGSSRANKRRSTLAIQWRRQRET